MRTTGHLAMEYLKMVSSTFMLHVPYRGTGPQLTDLMGGRIDAAAVGAPAVMQFIKSGRLRCIATGTSQRLSQLPDVPTVAEQGFPGFEMTQWCGMLAPASLSQARADKLALAAAKAVDRGSEFAGKRGCARHWQHQRGVRPFHRPGAATLEAGDCPREDQAGLNSLEHPVIGRQSAGGEGIFKVC